MNKRDLITALAERADISKSSAEEVVDTVFDAMAAAFARGDGDDDGEHADDTPPWEDQASEPAAESAA